jgi:hypothetical protein
MRIDREAFLLAVSALAGGCERADSTDTRSPPFPPTAAISQPKPASATTFTAREPVLEPPAPTPAPEPVVTPTPVVKDPAPGMPKATRRLTAAKRWFFALAAVDRTTVTSYCKDRRDHPCAGLVPRPKRPRAAPVEPDDVDPANPATDPAPAPEVDVEEDDNKTSEDKFLAKMNDKQRTQASMYCQETFPAPQCETPLVVAFDAQPVEFTAAGADQFAFVPDVPMSTDWPTATTPWIALDLDGDGAITSGAELFGSSTLLPGGTTAHDGFEALAPLDANGDGVLDARDPAFAKLVLWSDRNGDRRSTPDELRPLSSVVTAIPLAHTVDARCNARGDCEGERGALRWRDANGIEHTGAVVDVYVRRR